MAPGKRKKAIEEDEEPHEVLARKLASQKQTKLAFGKPPEPEPDEEDEDEDNDEDELSMGFLNKTTETKDKSRSQFSTIHASKPAGSGGGGSSSKAKVCPYPCACGSRPRLTRLLPTLAQGAPAAAPATSASGFRGKHSKKTGVAPSVPPPAKGKQRTLGSFGVTGGTSTGGSGKASKGGGSKGGGSTEAAEELEEEEGGGAAARLERAPATGLSTPLRQRQPLSVDGTGLLLHIYTAWATPSRIPRQLARGSGRGEG